MKVSRHVASVVVVMAFAVSVTGGMLIKSARVQDQSGGDSQESRIKRGFEIAPVPLSLEGKDRALVGLGSYLVNAVAACNDCHDAGALTQYEPGGNPFFGQRKKINPATYLGGGQDFGPLLPTPGSPHIVCRKLTPVQTGLPGVGRPFSQFRQIRIEGRDLDRADPPRAWTATTTS